MDLFILTTPRGRVRHLVAEGPMGTGARALCGKSTGMNAGYVKFYGEPWTGGDAHEICPRCVAATEAPPVP